MTARPWFVLLTLTVLSPRGLTDEKAPPKEFDVILRGVVVLHVVALVGAMVARCDRSPTRKPTSWRP